MIVSRWTFKYSNIPTRHIACATRHDSFTRSLFFFLYWKIRGEGGWLHLTSMHFPRSFVSSRLNKWVEPNPDHGQRSTTISTHVHCFLNIYKYIYIYIYTHTHTYTRTRYMHSKSDAGERERDGAGCCEWVIYISCMVHPLTPG